MSSPVEDGAGPPGPEGELERQLVRDLERLANDLLESLALLDAHAERAGRALDAPADTDTQDAE